MGKALLSLLLVCISVIQANNLIPWSAARKLTWSDFTGNADPHSSNAALTSSAINIEYGYDEKGFKYSITCNFDKNRSWVRIKTDEVLAHEQGHFDIAEINARRLNKLVKAYHFNAKTANSDLNKLYSDAMKQHRQEQLQYDEETDNSRNKPHQADWLAKIEQELKETAPYANYHH